MSMRLPLRSCGQSAIRERAAAPVRRCQQLRASRPRLLSARPYTTPPTASAPTSLRSPVPASPYHPPPPPNASPGADPSRRRSLRPYIWATLFTCIGLAGGHFTSLLLAPPPLPPAGSPEDDAMIAYIHQQAATLPVVQSLSADPAWVSHEAYTSLPPAERARRITTGALAGARALGGFQRVFTHVQTGEVVTVVWLGGAVAGWPGVTHGGAIATMLDETLGRCAARGLEGSTGVTAHLELNYLTPVQTNGFYVVRATPQVAPDDGTGDGSRRKMWVRGRLETTQGRVCVEARALFVVPKTYATRPIKTGF